MAWKSLEVDNNRQFWLNAYDLVGHAVDSILAPYTNTIFSDGYRLEKPLAIPPIDDCKTIKASYPNWWAFALGTN